MELSDSFAKVQGMKKLQTKLILAKIQLDFPKANSKPRNPMTLIIPKKPTSSSQPQMGFESSISIKLDTTIRGKIPP